MRVPAASAIRVAGRVLAIGTLAACAATAPDKQQDPASARIVSGNAQTGQVGAVAVSPFVVTVSDELGRPVAGAAVTWAVSTGNGRVAPLASTTDRTGTAQTVFTLGTTAGANAVTVSVPGVGAVVTFTATGTPGPLARVVVSAHEVTLCQAGATRVTATPTDAYGNPVPAQITWTSRDPAAVTVDSTGSAHLVNGAEGGYVVATSGGAAPDSTLIALGPSVSLAAGGVDETIGSSGFCVQSTQAGSEFALVAYNNAPAAAAKTTLQVQASGLAAIGSGANLVAVPAARAAVRRPPRIDDAFELQLRARERDQMPSHVEVARTWFRRVQQQRANGPAVTRAVGPATDAGAQQISATAKVGDLVRLNTNAWDFCNNATMATGRIEAISNTAIIVADTSNPAGGFTSADYAAFGATMDTLVTPVDVGAFGAPSDIDENGRTIVFFTKAVNELTTDPVNVGVVLGFFYARDLLPTTSCAGSNVAEMFYVLVPDPAGTINGGNTITRSEALVAQYAVSTLGHEFQHLINASRRMYVLDLPPSLVTEQTWLNEGLSHIAEELVFYRAAGLAPRMNIDATQLGSMKVTAAFNAFEAGDFLRFQTYLSDPQDYAPVGRSGDDNLYLRGAIQNFLRYLCDRLQSTDGNFWYRLVNDSSVGVDNLQHVIGADPAPYFRDWATSVFTDDEVPGVAPQFTEPSWNWRAVMPLASPDGFDLLTHVLSADTPAAVSLVGGGVSYFRFAVPVGQAASVTVSLPDGGPLPANIQLTLVRTR